MNFLAHTYLSGNDDDLKIGNFLGDFVKGRLNKLHNSPYSQGIIKGMALHREIDFFTDSHPIVRQSIDRLQPKYRKFSGIVVDMFYDNVFAKNFTDYSEVNLSEFSQQFYDLLILRKDEIPEPMDRMVNSMIKRNWFTSYATYEGIEWSLKGISQRLSFKSGIENATEDLKNDYELYEIEFKEFFPELIEHCQKFINANA
ncbi:acyl carrier protein phosphodiesterase [Arcicella aurantiaca]|uniref:Acyl carrier protein phosphodiesterase n=1 Tax=Arcicella aurantiaca TaxID=591202 RepID=A0A316E982_9BACT|nr:ACP phosphodiesterase [Arcicella aurantiaca]PWK27060.1 acyl carrier protein phosphodiesterase [Arcicella aurantiaca]